MYMKKDWSLRPPPLTIRRCVDDRDRRSPGLPPAGASFIFTPSGASASVGSKRRTGVAIQTCYFVRSLATGKLLATFAGHVEVSQRILRVFRQNL
jgi:hypothetical protein